MGDSFGHVIQGALSGQEAVSADGVAIVLRRCFEWGALDWRVSRRFEFVTKEEHVGCTEGEVWRETSRDAQTQESPH